MEIANEERRVRPTGMRLSLKGVSKTFEGKTEGGRVPVLRDISHEVTEGKFVSLVGPSGCGKTTLLRIISGLERVTEGRVLFDGHEISPNNAGVGLVFQEYALFPWRTTIQNIQTGLEIKGVSKGERRAAAMHYVEIFGLRGFEDRYPHELSGGMQQRVAIARTLIMNPRIVLMDEPFGSLDSQTRDDMQGFLMKLWEKRRDTILFVTHNVEEAVFLSDEVLVLSRRPAAIVQTFEIHLPRPRDRTSPECNAFRKAVLESLEGTREGPRCGDVRRGIC